VLAEAKLLHRGPHSFHYVGHPYPAGDVSLRGPLDENFLVVREPDGEILAEVDYEDVPNTLHEQAIYQLEGSLYQVLCLDHDTRRAHVTPADVNYFTDALTHTRVRVLERSEGDGAANLGEVHVLQRVVGFKKIRLHTHENLGFGEVNAPEREKHTTGLWLQTPAGALPDRHAPAEVAEAALGAATALHAAANLLLMSDGSDLGRAVGDARSDWFAVSGRRHRGPYSTPGDGSDLHGPMAPTIFLFDRYPGGTGLAERLYEERHRLLESARAAVARCPCTRGCPACVGPGASPGAKSLAVALLSALRLAAAPEASAA
jgi:DEAD/DEAH box helicase domain-containing protein